MPESHLTPEQVVAIRDDELRDWSVIHHLENCAECQARLREARTLRVLLSRPESTTSPHPGPEELAAYAEEALPTQDSKRLAAHVAACPQCFADLDALRTQLRQPAIPGESPPDWVVAAAVRGFQPPRPRMNLGRLVVEWARRLGLSVEYYPPVVEAFPSGPQLSQSARVESSWRASVGKLAPRKISSLKKAPAKKAAKKAPMRYMARRAEPVYEVELTGALAQPTPPPEPPEQESRPVEVAVGDFRVRIAVRGRTRDLVKLAVAITRQQDGTPAPGVRLALEDDQETFGAATTDTTGTAEFPLPLGHATLVFLSPVQAELKIRF